jgi:uncharacterized protein YbjT (DUF2867 family)
MILVTGGTGTSGVPIVEALLERAARVRVVARDPEKAAHLLGDSVEIARGDLADVDSIAAAMEGVDRALLNSAPDQRIVELQSNFVEAAKRAGLEYVVKFSAGGADSKSNRMFSRWHGQAEDALRASGIAWTMIRPNFFMENLFGMAPMVKECVIYQPTGTGRGAFVDVSDVASVAAACLMESGHEGEIYDVTGPESLSYADVAATLERVLDHPVHYRECSFEQAKQSMVQAGLPEWLADAINELGMGMKEGRLDKVTTVVRDVAKHRPRTLEEFISDNIAAFR